MGINDLNLETAIKDGRVMQDFELKSLLISRLKQCAIFLILSLSFALPAYSSEQSIYLRENLKRAQKGDFIVTAQGKNYTLLHIFDKTDLLLSIEEITIPASKIHAKNFSWRQWVQQGAPGNTAWILYVVNLATGQMQDFFSFSKNEWCNIAQADNFLSTLLNLRLCLIPKSDRRKVGPPPPTGSPDWRPYWQPQMVVNGQKISGVAFDAWRTHWPKDGSQLSGKLIEVYLPEENKKYPSYFPYWLQISGFVGKAKIRIVDSGNGLISPLSLPNKN